MPLTDKHVWTYEEVHQLVEDQEDRRIRYEFADGELLVTPTPGGYHQRLILDLFRAIDGYVRSNALGEVRLGPSQINVAPKTLFQPDLYVVPSVGGKRPRADVRVTSAVLIIEVLSPGSVKHDRVTKRRHYQNAGVPEYWIVDIEAEVVERWTPDDGRPEIIEGSIIWRPAGLAAALSLDLAALFRGIRDD